MNTGYNKNIVYLAGPIRGNPNFERDFDAAKELGQRLGYIVVSPVDLERLDNPGLIKNLTSQEAQKMYASRDTDAIISADCIVMLDGWQNSIGARAEYFLAVWCQLELLDKDFKPLSVKPVIKLESNNGSSKHTSRLFNFLSTKCKQFWVRLCVPNFV